MQADQKAFHLILADTGMGKTMFCLNYFSHATRKFPQLNFALVSLASSNADQQISRVINKAETVLIADAFDEDSKAFGRGRDRLFEIIQASADFKMVIITCRSQFFISEDAIPRETPLPILMPRQVGQGPTFSLIRSYISPFGPREIKKYLNKHFPVWEFWRFPSRQNAKELIDSVPDLVNRPMLLERLPELARTKSKSKEVYELYNLLVEGWLIRESRWVKFDDLLLISKELAITMYSQFQSRHGRISPDEIIASANRLLGESPNWSHLTSRSLLNRDSKGNFKFAHKSILEFLVVKAAIEGGDRALQISWTPFMKEMFVSWGHSSDGAENPQRARDILSSQEGRNSIAPLFDMHGTTAVRGLPNFKRAFERKFTSTGDRFSPVAWRQSSITIDRKLAGGEIEITDHEFNLRWQYLPNDFASDIPPLTLAKALRLDSEESGFKLPSLEQFLTLAQGLHHFGDNVLSNEAFFLLADQPLRHVHLLVQLNTEPSQSPIMKIVDRMRYLSGTPIFVNSYLCGSQYGSHYGSKIFVEHLRIRDFPSSFLL